MEGRRPYCCSCAAVGHIAKACFGKKAGTRPSQVTAGAAVVSFEVPDGEWKDVGKKGRKTSSTSPQQEVSQQAQPKERPEPEKQHQPLLQPPKGASEKRGAVTTEAGRTA